MVSQDAGTVPRAAVQLDAMADGICLGKWTSAKR